MTHLIGVSNRKVVGDLTMTSRRSSSTLIGFVLLSFSLEFHTILQALERQKFLMGMLLEVSR